jgi:hypothetical protein
MKSWLIEPTTNTLVKGASHSLYTDPRAFYRMSSCGRCRVAGRAAYVRDNG